MKKIICILLLLVNTWQVHAQQDSALIAALVKDIAAAQVKQDGEFYRGMFPSYRQCAGFPHNYQPDNNIFFTAITAFTLNNLQQYLGASQKTQVQEMISNAIPAYEHYRNKTGQPYYNFWPTHARILPHSYFIKYLSHLLAQGEDADDSVMILMAASNNNSDNIALKSRMVEVSNLSRRKINSTYKRYRDIPAYSTYLGQKMHPDFDFAVQCNVLYFMMEKKMPLIKQDSATIELLALMVKNREYMRTPVYISPCYVKPSILIYHISRLMGAFNIAQLQPYKDQLIADAKRLLRRNLNTMEEILLRTSLLRLGYEAPPLPAYSMREFEKTDQQTFVFFQARAAFAQRTPVKQVFLHWDYLNYFFYSPAYNKTLWLEYLLLKNNTRSK